MTAHGADAEQRPADFWLTGNELQRVCVCVFVFICIALNWFSFIPASNSQGLDL